MQIILWGRILFIPNAGQPAHCSAELSIYCVHSYFHKPLVVQEQSEKHKDGQKNFMRADSQHERNFPFLLSILFLQQRN